MAPLHRESRFAKNHGLRMRARKVFAEWCEDLGVSEDIQDQVVLCCSEEYLLRQLRENVLRRRFREVDDYDAWPTYPEPRNWRFLWRRTVAKILGWRSPRRMDAGGEWFSPEVNHALRHLMWPDLEEGHIGSPVHSSPPVDDCPPRPIVKDNPTSLEGKLRWSGGESGSHSEDLLQLPTVNNTPKPSVKGDDIGDGEDEVVKHDDSDGCPSNELHDPNANPLLSEEGAWLPITQPKSITQFGRSSSEEG